MSVMPRRQCICSSFLFYFEALRSVPTAIYCFLASQNPVPGIEVVDLHASSVLVLAADFYSSI